MKTLIEQIQGAFRNIRGDCADCGGPIGKDNGPLDGWQLEDGRDFARGACHRARAYWNGFSAKAA